jgi:hypothetical protein
MPRMIKARDPKCRDADDSEARDLAHSSLPGSDLEASKPRDPISRDHLSHHRIPTCIMQTFQDVAFRLLVTSPYKKQESFVTNSRCIRPTSQVVILGIPFDDSSRRLSSSRRVSPLHHLRSMQLRTKCYPFRAFSNTLPVLGLQSLPKVLKSSGPVHPPSHQI